MTNPAYLQALREGRISGPPVRTETPTWQPDQKAGTILNDGNGRARTGRVWDDPPLINNNTGRPYKGMLIDMTRNAGAGGAAVTAGGVLQIRAGSLGGSRFIRECVVGPGAPVYLEAGQYTHVNITLLTTDQGVSAPCSVQWTDGSALVAFGVPLLAPKVVPAAAVVVPLAVPEGAFTVIMQNACTVTWRDLSSGALQTFVDVVAPGGEVRAKGSSYTTDVDPGTVQFLLLPL